jgi:hypothetical protein
MTELHVSRVREVIIVATEPANTERPHPERAALVEARGALLYWDVLGRNAHPAAEIHDRALAADWLWEIYGPETADTILNGTGRIETAGASPVLDAARRLAHLRWAEAWWPSSHAASVPALDTGLLRAEAAWRTAAIEHLLDDDEAVERALAEADLASVEALANDPERESLTAALEDLAEDYGVELRREPAQLSREDWALAASGGHPVDFALASGGALVDWAQVPQGLVDAAAGATWALTQREGGLAITVTVPAAPEARELSLTALIGTVEIPLRLDPDTGNFTGEAEAPQTFLLLPANERELWVHSPDFAQGPTEPAEAPHRAALIEYARGRLTDPDASLAERAA